jgi:hypothetical protein
VLWVFVENKYRKPVNFTLKYLNKIQELVKEKDGVTFFYIGADTIMVRVPGRCGTTVP